MESAATPVSEYRFFGGPGTYVQRLPFQWSMSACVETSPTAHMSSGERAEAATNSPNPDPFGRGSATRCHAIPSQCTAVRDEPKPHTSVAAGATTAFSPALPVGAATCVHAVPSQCSTSGTTRRDRAEAEPPSARLRTRTTATPAAGRTRRQFMGRTVLPGANERLIDLD